MIPLTRLRHSQTFYLNPDLFERVDTHVDTVIRLIDGTEYVVAEPADEIIRRIAEFRARIIAVASVLQSTAYVPGNDGSTPTTVHFRELAPTDHAHPPTDPSPVAPGTSTEEDG